jgi:uridine kinase
MISKPADSTIPEYQQVEPRKTVEIHLPDGKVFQGPRHAPVGQFLKALLADESAPIVGAIVNGELRELTFPIKIDSYVRPVSMGEQDGMRIYRRSLVFLLAAAFDAIFPDAELIVDHSVASGGYYCHVTWDHPFSASETARLEAKMIELVEADLPFTRQVIPLVEARKIFEEKGEFEKVHLLSHRSKDYLTVYNLGDFYDYHHGYMVPSTGYVGWFQLIPTGEGFTLRFPRQQDPTHLSHFTEYPKLLNAFRRYGDWLELLGISSVGALNDAINNQRIEEIILVSEALHELHVTEIAAQIFNNKDQLRIVLISGPSSSGKTTFSKRLSVQLLARGISPFPIAMDDYFIDRDLTPLDEEGKPDYESIRALNLERLAGDLHGLVDGKKVHLPHFDFLSGKCLNGHSVQLQSNQIIIIEGIHGLNPGLFSEIPEIHAFRIYVSALTQLNLDRYNRISTTDTRLIRRVVRDARERGYSAYQTIQRWESVRRGEKRYIFPYQENADVMFNSALAYELSALKPLAEPLLRQVPSGTPEYVEAKRLLALLGWFLPIDVAGIPDNSLLREFIGSSILKDFTIWSNHGTVSPFGAEPLQTISPESPR